MSPIGVWESKGSYFNEADAIEYAKQLHNWYNNSTDIVWDNLLMG